MVHFAAAIPKMRSLSCMLRRAHNMLNGIPGYLG